MPTALPRLPPRTHARSHRLHGSSEAYGLAAVKAPPRRSCLAGAPAPGHYHPMRELPPSSRGEAGARLHPPPALTAQSVRFAFLLQAMATALLLASRPSLLEKVLNVLFCLLACEMGAIWLSGILVAQVSLGVPMPGRVWFQLIGVFGFMIFLCGLPQQRWPRVLV